MTRRACIAICVWFAACAVTRDVYVGSDYAPDSGRPATLPEVAAGRAAAPPPAAAGSDPGLSTPPVVCTGTTADCDGDPTNACEVDLTRDPRHCGQCALACQIPDCACRDGRLVVECPPGRADCDGNPSNGCEVDIQTSLQDCGACGRRCHTEGHDAIAAECVQGRCQLTCEIEMFPEGDCDGDPDNGCETQLWANDEHCGMCGRRCPCSNGACL